MGDGEAAGGGERGGGGELASGGERSTASQFSQALLGWFDVHGRRHLPWQRDPTPYRVWVSEVMLQQTQVAAVVPYYQRFMARFPTVASLAAAPEDEVLHLWTGLGYYARARNLRACAQVLVRDHGGEFPADLAGVMALPGIGRSTAGAILALSRDERHPILDGNAKRVLARVFGIAGDPTSAAVSAALWETAARCTPTTRVAAYTQAIMDLGATVCTRSRPACTVCPMSMRCVAAREGRQAELPGRKARRARPAREATLLIAVAVEGEMSAILLERRPAPGIWGGLWSPPQFESEPAALDWCRQEFGEPEGDEQRLAPIEHAFTHFDLRLHPVLVRCARRAVSGAGEVRDEVAGADVRRVRAAEMRDEGPGTDERRLRAERELREEGQDGEWLGVRELAQVNRGREGREGREVRERLWYSLDAPPRVGLPQPIRLLFDRLIGAEPMG